MSLCDAYGDLFVLYVEMYMWVIVLRLFVVKIATFFYEKVVDGEVCKTDLQSKNYIMVHERN